MPSPLHAQRKLILLLVLALAILLNACAAPAPAVPAATAPAATNPPAAATSTSAPATPVPATATLAPTATSVPATATTAPTATAEVISVKDGAGVEFRLEKPAAKIISLAPSNTEILFAIGAGKQVVGRDDFSNYPEEAGKLPSVGGSMSKYNLEEIAKAQPDLILVSPLTQADALKSLKDITPNVFMVANPKNLDEMYATLVLVGTLTGHKAEAEKLAADLQARAKVVVDKMASVTEKPKVFYELDATDPAKPWTAGPGTFIDVLVGLAGGKNIGAELKGDWAQLSQEELIVQNPDIILLGDSTYGGIKPEQVAARPGWNGIKAVKDSKVLEFNDDLVSRPGPRLIDGLEALAKVIHPELFK